MSTSHQETAGNVALITGPSRSIGAQSPNDHRWPLLAHAERCYTTKSNYKQTNYEETSYEPGDTGRGAPSIRYQSEIQTFLLATATKSRCVCNYRITGQIGGGVARTLLDARKSVRAVIRDSAKGEMWAQQGCEVALAAYGGPGTPCNEHSRVPSGFRAPAAEL